MKRSNYRQSPRKIILRACALGLLLGGALGACAQAAEEPEDDESLTTATTVGTTGVGGQMATTGVGVTTTGVGVTTTGVGPTTTTGQGGATTTTTAVTTTAATTTGGPGSCLDNETCMGGNDVCDPQTAMCDGTVQCDGTISCPNGNFCLAQEDMATVGACYDGCVPGGATCGAGYECLDITAISLEGACFQTGMATAKQNCTFHDINSGCQSGLTCSDGQCEQLCDFWNASNCTAGADRCFLGGVCRDDAINSAGIGNLCFGAQNGDPCAAQGERAAGVCLDDGIFIECVEWCRAGANDCPSGKICADVNLNIPVGACL